MLRKLGAKVFRVEHESIFHKTKQKAIDRARGSWILQLDADEVVSPKLADEISGAPILRRPLNPVDVGPSWMNGDPSLLRRIPDPAPIPDLPER